MEVADLEGRSRIQSPTWELNPAQRAYQARASNQLACRQWTHEGSNLGAPGFNRLLFQLSYKSLERLAGIEPATLTLAR